MANLSASELLKYDWRIDKFISKYKNEETFELSGGQKVKLSYNDETLKALKTKKQAVLSKIEFQNSRSKGLKYKLTAFKKNEEFGGKVAGKSAGADVKVPSGGQRKFGATRKPKGGSGKRQLPLNLRGAGYSETQRESVDFELLAQYILEDFIAEGYANNYEDALEILENLSEESILELTEMYLEG